MDINDQPVKLLSVVLASNVSPTSIVFFKHHHTLSKCQVNSRNIVLFQLWLLPLHINKIHTYLWNCNLKKNIEMLTIQLTLNLRTEEFILTLAWKFWYKDIPTKFLHSTYTKSESSMLSLVITRFGA